MNNSSSSSLRNWDTCIDTAASVTPSSCAAPLTEPWRTTLEKALNCAGVTAVKIPSSHIDDKTPRTVQNLGRMGVNKRRIGANKRRIGANKRRIGLNKRRIGVNKRQ